MSSFTTNTEKMSKNISKNDINNIINIISNKLIQLEDVIKELKEKKSRIENEKEREREREKEKEKENIIKTTKVSPYVNKNYHSLRDCPILSRAAASNYYN